LPAPSTAAIGEVEVTATLASPSPTSTRTLSGTVPAGAPSAVPGKYVPRISL
jgi:hypothetical protein